MDLDMDDSDIARRRRNVLLASFAVIGVMALTFLIPALMHNNTYEVAFSAETTAANTAELLQDVPHRRLGDVIWLELEPGDSLVITNTDTEIHELAGMTVRPGETLLHTFYERGTFSGDCSVIDLTMFIEVERR